MICYQLMLVNWVYAWYATSSTGEVSVCLVCYQLLPVKWVYVKHITSLCQISECIPGLLPDHPVKWCMPVMLPVYASEVSDYLAHNQLMPVKRMYAWNINSVCQWRTWVYAWCTTSWCQWSKGIPRTQPAYASEVWSECMSVCYQLMPAKGVYTWHTTSLCQWSECMPGTQPAYASDVRECMPGVLPADASEVRVCLVHNQHMPVKCAYACFTTSFYQWSACMAGMITDYASEVSLCLVCYQLMSPVKWIYTWYVTSLFQWS